MQILGNATRRALSKASAPYSTQPKEHHDHILRLANLFQLAGKGLHVTYSTTGIDGKAHLHYQDSKHNRDFSGNEIRTAEFDLGTVVSVSIQTTIDSGSASFSIPIPRINLKSGEIGQVRTEDITTIHRFSILPPLNHGQLDLYSSRRGSLRT